MIFHPGFSTARRVTEVSGRGVDMDVVRQNVAAVGGPSNWATSATPSQHRRTTCSISTKPSSGWRPLTLAAPNW